MKKIQKYLTVFFVLSFLVVNFPLNVFAWSHYPRLYGDDRYQTSKAVAEKYNSGQTDNIVITTGTNFPDALSVSTLAGKLKAPILLVNQTVSQSQDALDYISEHMANGKVWIAGGTGVINSTFESELSSMGNTVERVAGLDRYETCLRVAEKVNAPKGTSVFLATGENFPDALSIASVAASEGYPVILTPKDKLSDGVKNYLLKQQPSEVFIIGGTGVISESVESAVKNILPASSITRLAGQDRYETSIEAYNNFFNDPVNIYIASGTDFADALSASVLAAKDNAPIVLVDSKKKIPPESTICYLEYLGALDYPYDPSNPLPPDMWHLIRKQLNITIIGGQGAVLEKLASNIMHLVEKPPGTGRGYMQNSSLPPDDCDYSIPKSHHFYDIEGSSMPGNKDYAEFSIIMNCMNRQTRQYDTELYKLQLQELRTVILPVLGEDITNKIIQAAERKTHENITIDETFETDTKKVDIGSTPGYYHVHFKSWAK